MNVENFRDLIESKSAVIAYFSYPDCAVCKVLRPEVEKLVTRQPDSRFVYVNIHERLEISGQYLVFTVPTVILFQNGREVKRFSRHFSVGEFEAELNRLVKNA